MHVAGTLSNHKTTTNLSFECLLNLSVCVFHNFTYVIFGLCQQHMDLLSQLYSPIFIRPSIQLSVCLAWQKLCCWTLLANFSTRFIHSCHQLLGTNDVYHFILISMALTLAGSHKVSAEQSVLVSLIRLKLDLLM